MSAWASCRAADDGPVAPRGRCGYARRMSFTGRRRRRAEALRVGLVTEVVPHQQLLARERGSSREAIAEMPPRTMGALKRIYVEGGRAVVDPALEAERRTTAQVPAGMGQGGRASPRRDRAQSGPARRR